MSTQSTELSQSELTVLESLQGTNETVSQRELARRTGFSVGLINAVLKKLVQTGYVKTSHLDRRTVEYLLTPQGFAQAAMRSYRYVIETVRRYRAIKNRLHEIVGDLRADGFTQYFLHGDGELADVVGLFFAEEDAGELLRGIIPKNLVKSPKLAVLNTEPNPFKSEGRRVVDLVHEFSNGHKHQDRSKTQKKRAVAPKASSTDVSALKEFYAKR